MSVKSHVENGVIQTVFSCCWVLGWNKMFGESLNWKENVNEKRFIQQIKTRYDADAYQYWHVNLHK